MKKLILLLTLVISSYSYAQEVIDLPITWEGAAVDYTVTDFPDDAAMNSMVVADPTDATNSVLQTDRGNDVPTWAGTTLSTPNGLANPIAFDATHTIVSVRVWSPDAGIPVRLKAEDHNDNTHSVETEAMTTMAGAWETLEFDFSNEAAGTAAINFDYTYDMLSIFFNFGTDGATAGAKTYYSDDVIFEAGTTLSQIDLPITWEGAAVDYTVTDFPDDAAMNSMVVADPTDATNTVLRTDRGNDVPTWAGTTLSTPNGLANPIAFDATHTIVSVRVWSPDAGIPIRLKAEDHNDNTHSVETEAMTTMAGAWETLEFDFSNEAAGTAAINFDYTYDMLSLFFNFGTDGATAGAKTYYSDDVIFEAGTTLSQIDLPITWEDAAVDYTVTDFPDDGSVSSAVVADPTDGTNTVLETNRGVGSPLWGGTTLSTPNGLANPIAFDAEHTIVKVRVWSPDAGTPVRLKAEDHTDPTHSVETETMTTSAATWEELEFDFSNEVSGTAAINFSFTYDMLSIFYNFGTDGATAGAKTYYCDDISFEESTVDPGALYCNTEVTHLGIPAEEASKIYLTVANTGANSMIVEIESANDDPVDLLVIPDASGAAISDEDLTSPGKISRTLTWTETPPEMVSLNVLWSKNSFGGNWQLSPENVDVPFTDTCGAPQPANVTFHVDMNEYTGTFTNVYVSGSFNGWSGDANPMNDDDADGVWTTTLPIENGPIEYKYTHDNWDGQENFTDGMSCTITNVDGFINRSLNVAGDAVLPIVCWEACVGCGELEQINLPIDWESDMVDYTVTDFPEDGSMISGVVVDPTDASNNVLQSDRGVGAPTWAGTTLSTPDGLANPIAFDATHNTITVRVWSPDAGIAVRLKAEDHNDATHSVETEAMTTAPGVWDTLTFDFRNEVEGTAAINYDYTYDKISIFYNFGVDGATAGAKTYYCDDIEFGADEASTESEITFKVDMNTYEAAFTAVYVSGSFNGWSGTSNPMTDDDADGVYETTLTLANETIEYKFTLDDWTVQEEFVGGESCTVTNDGFTNRQLIIESSQILTAVCWNSCDACPGLPQIDLPIDWEGDEVDYTVTDFGDNMSMLVTDPVNAENTVLQTDRAVTAPTWAGTTLSTPAGLANPIAFDATNNTFKVDVYSPEAGVEIRLKAEDHMDPTHSVETTANTTVAGTWETLTFDFRNEAPGTAPINYTYTFDMLSIFFNFGVEGAVAGAQTYYCDNIEFHPDEILPTNNVTFKVDMNDAGGTFTTVYVSGTFNEWSGESNPMTDDDGDGVWETTLPIPAGGIEFKYTLDNWAGQEEFSPGDWCTVTNGGFTNRFMEVTADTVMEAACWNSCDACTGFPTSADVTFKVDLSGYTGSYEMVNLNGTFNGWCGSCAVMTDDDNDDIYELTLNLSTADTAEYKFTLGGWTVEEQLTDGSICTMTTVDGGNTFINRFIVLTADTVLPAVCWEYCVDCQSIGITENQWMQNLQVVPNPSDGQFRVQGEFPSALRYTLSITDLQGKVIYQTVGSSQVLNETIRLNELENGFYFVNIATDSGNTTEKIMVLK